MSNPANITCGVPQGSVLGPLLFLLYIHDLCGVLANSKPYLYADDTVMVSNAPNLQMAYLQLQHDLNNVANWCKGNKLSINIKKTKGMLVGTRSMVKKLHLLPKLKIQGGTIDYVFQYKYLGITIDEILSFRTHLNNTIKLVAHKISILSKIRCYITKDASLKLYKTMILPYLDYGDIFFMNSTLKQIKKLQTLQNRALRICTQNKVYIPTNILHQSVQLPKLDVRRETHLANFMYKYKNNELYVNKRNIRTRLHDAHVFKTTKPDCERFRNNVFYCGAVKWNSLSVADRNIDSYLKFKQVQKRWALQKLY